jgi:hypothetical protein
MTSVPSLNMSTNSPTGRLSATASPRVKKKAVKVIILSGGPSKGKKNKK